MRKDVYALFVIVTLTTAGYSVAGQQEKPSPATETPQQPKLRKELLERLKNDQEIRRNPVVLKIFAQPTEKNKDIKTLNILALQKMLRIDKENREWLKGVVKEHGWPGKTLVGSDGAKAAFLRIS